MADEEEGFIEVVEEVKAAPAALQAPNDIPEKLQTLVGTSFAQIKVSMEIDKIGRQMKQLQAVSKIMEADVIKLRRAATLEIRRSFKNKEYMNDLYQMNKSERSCAILRPLFTLDRVLRPAFCRRVPVFLEKKGSILMLGLHVSATFNGNFLGRFFSFLPVDYFIPSRWPMTDDTFADHLQGNSKNHLLGYPAYETYAKTCDEYLHREYFMQAMGTICSVKLASRDQRLFEFARDQIVLEAENLKAVDPSFERVIDNFIKNGADIAKVGFSDSDSYNQRRIHLRWTSKEEETTKKQKVKN